jgi:hypothetical protein
MLVPRFTEERRQEILAKGEQSLLYFATTIIGADSPHADLGYERFGKLHEELIDALEGGDGWGVDWTRGMVSAFRGSLKSTICTIIRPLQRTLYRVNHSIKIIENSADNAKINHFLPAQRIFMSGPQSDFLQWLYSHRIPEDFAGWTTEQLHWNTTDPLAPPALSYWGVTSKMEGAHPDEIVIDDPEGAEAEESPIANANARLCIAQCEPLLKDQRRSRLLLVATPWGKSPIVYFILDREHGGTFDNSKRVWKVFWREILDEHGESRWPEKFPPEVIEALKLSDLWETQYRLHRRGKTGDAFPLDALERNRYTIDGATGHLVYMTREFDPALVGKEQQEMGVQTPAGVHPTEMRYFGHFDPLHKDEAERIHKRRRDTPAKAAVAVTAVAPDGHVFLIQPWTKDAPLDEQAEWVFRMYRKYACHRFTYESIGAQFWFLAYVKQRERVDAVWANPRTIGPLWDPPFALPPLSSRLIEAGKHTEAKEYIYRVSFAPWINGGYFHTHARHAEFDHQLAHHLDENFEKDLIDAVAQGAGTDKEKRLIWSRPIADVMRNRQRARQVRAQHDRDPRSGYVSPYSGGIIRQPGVPVPPPGMTFGVPGPLSGSVRH